MPKTVTGLDIDPGGTTCVVSIADNTGGIATSVYTAQNGSTNVVFPVTITTPTTYYFTQTGLFTVSLKIGGVEVATFNRQPVQVVLNESASSAGGVGPAFLPPATVLDALGSGVVNAVSAPFGADPTGLRDSTTALQSAINTATSAGALTTVRKALNEVVIPAGTYLITAPLNIQSVQGFSFRGAGRDITIFNYQPGGAVNNFLNIDGCANGRFAGFTVNCKGSGITDVAIDLNWSSPGVIGRSTSNNVFQDVVVNFSTSGGPRAGFGVGVRSGGNQVDNTSFYNCLANGNRVIGSADTTKYQQGWALGNGTFGNVLDIFLYNCSAVRWFQGVAANATSFYLYGSQPAANEVDFVVSNSGTSSINAVRSEAASRLLTTNSSSASMGVSLSDILWTPNAINADGQFIKMTCAGTLKLSNVYLTTPAHTPTILAHVSGENPLQILAEAVTLQVALGSLFNISGPNVTVTVIDYTQTDTSNQVVKRTPHALVTTRGVIFSIGSDGQVGHTVNAISVASGAYDIDASRGDIAAITLGGNVGAATVTNPSVGQILTIEFIQDATGGRAYTWPVNAVFAGGSAPAASSTANYRDSVTLRFDGTNWVESGRAVGVH